MNRIALYATVALVPFLCAATVSQGNFYGRYNDGVYTAPGKLFRVSSPFPDEPIVSDGSEPANNNAGAVSFIDNAGRLMGILYMDNRDGSSTNADESKRIGDWFRDTGFPRFFQVAIPDGKILRDEPGKIGGNPAWIAVAHLPKASPLGTVAREGDEPRRNDSWRGMAVVAKGNRYYVLQTELRIEKLASPNWQYDAEAADWNAFVPELESLYERIEFLK